MTTYTLFTLDGFHNRQLDGWREVVSRVAYPASVRPAYYTSKGKRVPPQQLPPGAIVQRSDWRSTARKHAMKHGTAGVWHADDSFTLFYRDGDKVRTKRFPHAKPIATAA